MRIEMEWAKPGDRVFNMPAKKVVVKEAWGSVDSKNPGTEVFSPQQVLEKDGAAILNARRIDVLKKATRMVVNNKTGLQEPVTVEPLTVVLVRYNFGHAPGKQINKEAYKDLMKTPW